MKAFLNSYRLQILLPIMISVLLNPVLAQGGTVPTIALPQKTITVFDVAISKPTGDPITAPTLDNQFTYSGNAGIATIAVQADITPLKLEGSVNDLIKWTFTSIPAGSVLTWGNDTWPGESTAGKGKSAVATLTGYPANNSEFGPRIIKMEVIRNGKVLLTKTTTIQLFFKRDDTATGRNVPNWVFYWLQAMNSTANVVYQSINPDLFGETPAMVYWSYLSAHDKTKITVHDNARKEDNGVWGGYFDVTGAWQACSAHIPVITTGIDAFRDTIVHESAHLSQIARADTIVGITSGTPWRFGWSWSQGLLHNHWAVGADGKPGAAGVDDDTNGTVDDLIDSGPGELGGVLKLPINGPDVLLSVPSSAIYGHESDSDWPKDFGSLPAGCWPTGYAVEQPAYASEPDDQDGLKDVDWAAPGKQYLTGNYLN